MKKNIAWTLFTSLLVFLKDVLYWFVHTKIFRRQYSEHDIVECVERQGPVFIKLFQHITQHNLLLSSELRSEAERLRDHTTPHSWSYTEKVLTEELTGQYRYILKSMDRTPHASGSVAQVYRAVLEDGTRVAVKVLHPDVHDKIEAATRVMEFVFWIGQWMGVHRISDHSGFYDLLKRQTDLRGEMKYLQELKQQVNLYSMIHVPTPLLATNRIIIETFEYGCPLEEFIQEHPFYSNEAICLFLCLYYYLTVRTKKIHGDPHLGNFLFRLVDGKVHIVILDAGLLYEVGKHEMKWIREAEVVPYVWQWDKVLDVTRDANTNPAAAIALFEKESKKLFSSYSQKTNVIKANRFCHNIFYDLCSRSQIENPVMKMLSLSYKHNISFTGNYLLFMLSTNMVFRTCFDLSKQREHLVHDYVEYGIRNNFFKLTPQCRRILNQRIRLRERLIKRQIRDVQA